MQKIIKTPEEAMEALRDIEKYAKRRCGRYVFGAIAVGYAPDEATGIPSKIQHAPINFLNAPFHFGLAAIKGMILNLEDSFGTPPNAIKKDKKDVMTG